MAIIRTDDAHYKAIAAKIREKTGLETTYKPSEIVNGIEEVYNAGQGSSDPLIGIIDNTIVNLYSAQKVNIIRAHAFNGCTKLESIDLPNLTGQINGYAFIGCTALNNINFPNMNSFLGTQAFANCKSLKTISLPKVTYTNGDPFLNSGVEIVDLGTCQLIYSQPFQGCTALKALILRRNGICTLSQSNAFANTNIANGTAYIYVPDTQVENYKAATNWSNYANQIRGLNELENALEE